MRTELVLLATLSTDVNDVLKPTLEQLLPPGFCLLIHLSSDFICSGLFFS